MNHVELQECEVYRKPVLHYAKAYSHCRDPKCQMEPVTGCVQTLLHVTFLLGLLWNLISCIFFLQR
jgi:hypothetical protein